MEHKGVSLRITYCIYLLNHLMHILLVIFIVGLGECVTANGDFMNRLKRWHTCKQFAGENTSPYRDPDQSKPYPPILLSYDSF